MVQVVSELLVDDVVHRARALLVITSAWCPVSEASSRRHMELQSNATFARAVTSPSAHIDTKTCCHRAILQVPAPASSAALLTSFARCTTPAPLSICSASR